MILAGKQISIKPILYIYFVLLFLVLSLQIILGFVGSSFTNTIRNEFDGLIKFFYPENNVSRLISIISLITLATVLLISNFLSGTEYDIQRATIQIKMNEIDWEYYVYPTYQVYIVAFVVTSIARLIYEITSFNFVLPIVFLILFVLFTFANIGMCLGVFLFRYNLGKAKLGFIKEIGLMILNIGFSYILLLPSLFIASPAAPGFI